MALLDYFAAARTSLSPLQTDSTLLASNSHCWELLANDVESVFTYLKGWPVSNFAQELPATCNRVCKIKQHASKQCWKFLTNNVAYVCTGLYYICVHWKILKIYLASKKMVLTPINATRSSEIATWVYLKPSPNGRNIVGQPLPTLLDAESICLVGYCSRLVVWNCRIAQSLRPVKL